MKVLQILLSLAPEFGGPVRSTLATCRAVHAVDSEITSTLASTGQNLDPAWLTSFADRMPPGMNLRMFPAVGTGAFTFSPRLAAWLYRHLLDYDLVVIRGMFSPVSAIAAWTARWRGIPYIMVPHGTLSSYTFEYRRSLMKRAHFYVVGRHMLSEAAGVQFTSHTERREAPPWGNSSQVSVIPHPYEPEFDLDESRNEEPNQVLFLSRLHPVKGVDVLLEAVSGARRQISTLRLILAGSGAETYEDHVRSRIHQLQLENVVEMPGFVVGENKRSLLMRSAVFVLPSQQENFGNSVVEAMDAGVPVVISRGVNIWDQVEQAEAGIVVENRTADEVSEAIVRLLRNPGLRARMGANGRQLVRESFDPATVGRQVVKLYHTCAQHRCRH